MPLGAIIIMRHRFKVVIYKKPMHKTFTINDLLLLAYNDPKLEDKEELEAEITFCETLSDKAEQILELKNKLDNLYESAPLNSVNALLNFSKSLKVEKSDTFGNKVTMILN